jgi:hypothetical protein
LIAVCESSASIAGTAKYKMRWTSASARNVPGRVGAATRMEVRQCTGLARPLTSRACVAYARDSGREFGEKETTT